MMRFSLALLALLALAAALAGCGGGGDGRDGADEQAPEAVIRAWADDLRRGDVDAAAARFALPAVVANNTPRITLRTRAEVRFFNRTLPCGGRVVATERHRGVVIATFVLTERPGGDCGAGTGRTARTAFEVRGGRIVRWLRLPDAPPGRPV